MFHIKRYIPILVLKGFCLSCLLCIFAPTTGQSLYLSTTHNHIYRIENDYSLTYIITANYPKTLTDIAFSSTGELYGIASEDLVKIDLQSGAVNFLFQLLGGDYSNSLACSHDDKLYLRGVSSNLLYAYNIVDSSMQLIHHFGADEAYDITFYKGNILMPSNYRRQIDAYDIQEKTLSKIACQVHVVGFNGISNVMDSCGSEHVYAIGSYSTLWEINFVDHQTVQAYDYWPTGLNFGGMASVSEYLGSTCYSHLEPVECTWVTGVEETSLNAIIDFYPNPVSETIFFKSDLASAIHIKLYCLTGQLMYEQEGILPIDVSEYPAGIYYLEMMSPPSNVKLNYKVMKL